MRSLLAAVAFLCLFAACALAKDARVREHHNVNVTTNREDRLSYYASPDADCEHGTLVQITVAEAPSYGKIYFRPDRLLAYTATIPVRASACRGKFVDVMTVMYKPARDFHGSDRVVLRVHFPASTNGPATTVYDEIFITVR